MDAEEEATAGEGPRCDVQGGGQSSGVPAAGLHDGTSYSPTGGPGALHWKEATISKPGLDDRGGVFFAAVEMTRMPMVLTDPNLPDNPIVFANRAFQDLTGYRQDEILGRNCRFLQGAQTNRAQVAELRRAIEERRPVSVELLNYKRDGTPFWNAVFLAPVYGRAEGGGEGGDDGADGKLLYFFASQLDVTRRRMSEQAFRQAQKMESIGQLTAGLAHDFNNLLQVVAGNLELLRDELGDSDLQLYAERAGEAAERGARLTKQLLAFARKTRLEPKVVDVNALVNDFAGMLESTVGAHVELQLNLRRRLPAVRVDPVHLELALLNVAINARDAMPGGGTLTIATSLATVEDGIAGEAAARHVVLSVADEGTGMPAHVLERATEPFFTTKSQGKGTGLGLAMVHGFVQQSLGKLEIGSVPGCGTTVRMLFPATDDAAPPRRPAGTGPAAERGRPEATETILVVEASDDVLVLARDYLRTVGYRVLTARNADEALALLDRPDLGRIDLLFSDILMPGSMNGIVLAERVRERLPGTAILLTTGYNEELAQEGPGTPAADVIGKPYRRTELADRVRAALNRKADALRHAAAPRGYEGPAHEA